VKCFIKDYYISMNASSPSKISAESISNKKISVTTEDLKRQIKELKDRLAIYEDENEDRKAENVEEEKKRVRKVFDIFDADKSNFIDEHEFQDLAFQLGETLTMEEVRGFIKQIDTDGNGTVEFEEFFAWWQSDYESSDKQGKMKALKLKLKSKAYIRTVSRMGSKLSRANEKKKEQDPTMAILDLDITIGKYDQSKASIQVIYHRDAELAKKNLTRLMGSSNSLIASVSFLIRPGVDDFSLGELSGSVKDLLMMVKKEVKFTEYKTMVQNLETGQKLYVVTLYFNEQQATKSALGSLESIAAKKFEAAIHLNQTPKRGEPEEIPRGKITLNVEVPRESVEFLKSVLKEGEKEYKTEEQKEIDYFLKLMKTIMSIKVGATFDDFTDFFKALSKTKQESAPIEGFGAIRKFLKPLIKGLVEDEDVPPPLKSTYDTMVTLVEGIHSMTGQIGEHVLSVEFKDLPIVDLLPTPNELRTEHESSSESEDW